MREITKIKCGVKFVQGSFYAVIFVTMLIVWKIRKNKMKIKKK